ncbi:hypothetical protein G6F56_011842 [Rhizopus delemar]|nr:hypothetical protein G6F56_011842 [Rhizopus delemar]
MFLTLLEFAGLHIDPKVIGAKNSKIQGEHIRRKNNCIVNTGGKLSREELKKKVLSNKKEYELPEDTWKTIELIKVEDPVAILEQKREDLKILQQKLEKVQASIAKMRNAQPDRMDKLKSEVTQSPSVSTPGTPTTDMQQDKEEEEDEMSEMTVEINEKEMKEVEMKEVEEEIQIDDDGDFVIDESNMRDAEDDGCEDMQTSAVDEDYALALKLQREEDQLYDEYSEEEEVINFSKKKRRVARK